MSTAVERAKEALEDAKGWSVFAGWVCEHVDQCTCDGPFETYGHRPECGLVPLAETGKVPALAFAEVARAIMPELVAEIERLHSWDGLMELLDEHWPEDIFPTLPDTDKRDPGPRIVSLLRMVDQLRQSAEVVGRG